jgi:hypothetical protein
MAAGLVTMTACGGVPDEEIEDVGAAEEALIQCVEVRDGIAGDVQDAYIWSLYPGYNTGNAPEESVGLSHGGAQQALVRADLSMVPIGATVTSATLTLLLSSSAAATVSAHRVTTGWSESAVTWSTFNGAYDPAVVASVAVSGFGAERTFNITALAAGWANGTIPNYGLLLQRDLTSTTTFKGSEDANLSRRPRFTVCYDTGSAPPGTSASSGSSSASSSGSSSASSSGSSTSGAGGAGGAGGSGGSGGDPNGFDPTDIPGCRWWMRADSVVTSGQYVVSLNDRSGNGHAVTQSDPAKQAKLIPSSAAFNGQPTLSFTRAQWYEKLGGISFPFGNQPVSAIMVGSMTTLPDIGPNPFFAYYGGGGSFESSPTHIYARVQGVNRFRTYAENPYTSTLTAGTQGTAHIFGFTFTQGDLRTYRDGAAGEAFQAQMWGGSANPSLRVGTSDNGTPYSLYNGEIAEIMLFNTALTAASRQQLEQYLKARYGIQ